MTSQFRLRNYDTRLDRFRARHRIGIRAWADAAGIGRTQLNKYRSGTMEPGAAIFAALVRSAATILERPIKAAELFDFGEDEPVAPTPRKRGDPKPSRVRKRYETRLDNLLRRLGVPAAAVAREAGITRQGLLRFRRGQGISVSTVGLLVRALRRMGHAVKASDIVDLGEK